MALMIKSFFTSLMILVALIGAAVGGTVQKVGDSKGWTMMGADYEAWASSRTFKVGDSLVFEYNSDFHDVTEVTPHDFELCEPSSPLATYKTGSDTVSLTKPGIRNFICGTPGHCELGQKLQILVLPASLGPVAAPVPRPVRSTSSSSSPSPSPLADSPVSPLADSPVRSTSSTSSPSPSPLADSPVNDGSHYQMGPSPAPQSAASNSSVWIGSYFLVSLLSLFILV